MLKVKNADVICYLSRHWFLYNEDKCQNINMEMISETNSSYISNDLKNSNESFRRGLIYDNIITVT